jgi:hypothetical protein
MGPRDLSETKGFPMEVMSGFIGENFIFCEIASLHLEKYKYEMDSESRSATHLTEDA